MLARLYAIQRLCGHDAARRSLSLLREPTPGSAGLGAGMRALQRMVEEDRNVADQPATGAAPSAGPFKFRRLDAVNYTVKVATEAAITVELWVEGDLRNPIGRAVLRIRHPGNTEARSSEEERVAGGLSEPYAYLSNLLNHSRTIPQKGDIYEGVGRVLLAKVEEIARTAGAKSVLLQNDPTAMARTDPNEATTKPFDSGPFYEHMGFKRAEQQAQSTRSQHGVWFVKSL